MKFLNKILMPFFLILGLLMFCFIWVSDLQAPAQAYETPATNPPVHAEPKDAESYFQRGFNLRSLHKIDEAIADFSTAIKLSPQQSVYYLERSNARILNKDYPGAISDASEAIRLLPENAEAYFFRGLAQMLSGHLEQALLDSMKAMQIKPDSYHARRLFFEACVKIDAAIEAFNTDKK